MYMQAKRLMDVLEDRFGVPREFAAPLLPMLERVASRDPSSEEWLGVLEGIAGAYRVSGASGISVPPREEGPEREEGQDEAAEGEVDEVCGLMRQFSDELRKLDESLKVLTAYLERVHQQLHPSLGSRLLH